MADVYSSSSPHQTNFSPDSSSNLSLRIFTILLPAFYCCWLALQTTFHHLPLQHQRHQNGGNSARLGHHRPPEVVVGDRANLHPDLKVAVAVEVGSKDNKSLAESRSSAVHHDVNVVASGNQNQATAKEKTGTRVASDKNGIKNVTTDTELPSPCFLSNSPEWLAGPRLGNVEDANFLNDAFAREMILMESLPSLMMPSPPSSSADLRPYGPTIFGSTICHKNSRFVNAYNKEYTPVETAEEMNIWTVRLIYLAIHWHQHSPAFREAESRLSSESVSLCQQQPAQQQNLQSRVGAFDFECPAAKFLVVSLGDVGIGANVRLGAVPALMVGVATNRVVLFVNNVNNTMAGANQSFRKPWSLASCDRQDYQCSFLPSSPCVLTQEEISKAHTLKRSERRRAFRYGVLPPEHAQDRVVVMQLTFRPQRTPENLLPALQQLAVHLLNDPKVFPQSSPLHNIDSLKQRSILHRAVENILSVKEALTSNASSTFSYFGASLVHKSLALYAMRPLPQVTLQMEDILSDIFPRGYDPEHTAGLPIRGSDKCGAESECLSFKQYMKAISNLWGKESRGRGTREHQSARPVTSVLVTTESQTVLREQRYFAAMHSNLSNNSTRTLRKSQENTSGDDDVFVPYRFITNHRDVVQDTGYLKDIAGNEHIKADEAMVSALSSLRAQLTAKVTVGNCCSNFHLLLSDLLYVGCGINSKQTFQCLQDNEDPELQVCCSWDMSIRCQARRNRTSSM